MFLKIALHLSFHFIWEVERQRETETDLSIGLLSKVCIWWNSALSKLGAWNSGQGLPCVQQGSKHLSHHLLLLEVYICRKLGSEVEREFKPVIWMAVGILNQKITPRLLLILFIVDILTTTIFFITIIFIGVF